MDARETEVARKANWSSKEDGKRRDERSEEGTEEQSEGRTEDLKVPDGGRKRIGGRNAER